MAAWPPALPSSIATPAMPRACQANSWAGPSRRAIRMAPGTRSGASASLSRLASRRSAKSSRSANRSRRYGSTIRRIRPRTSLATWCTAASAESPPRTASVTRRNHPGSAATRRVASITSRGASPSGSWASISASSSRRIVAKAASKRASSGLGSCASNRLGARRAPCSTANPRTMPGDNTAASKCRGTVPKNPFSGASSASLVSVSITSRATVSSTSTSSSV